MTEMVLLRGGIIGVSAISGGHSFSRAQFSSLYTVQVYMAGGMTWSRKAIIVRNPPHTIDDPTLGQAELRKDFGEIAHTAAGQPKTGPLPPAAEAVMNKHPHAEDVEPITAWASRSFHTVHTLNQLDQIIAQKKEKQTRALSRRMR